MSLIYKISSKQEDLSTPPADKKEKEVKGNHTLSQDPSLTQALLNIQNIQPREKVNPDPKVDISSGSMGSLLPKKEICHFYTINKCKFGKDCRRAHPKICIKFKKFGLKKFYKNGCNKSCENYHPKACFEAMKTKNCKRSDCKFVHVSGTKKTEGVGLHWPSGLRRQILISWMRKIVGSNLGDVLYIDRFLLLEID